MIEDQFPQEPIQRQSQPKWTLWIAAGGCAIFVCAAVLVGLLLAFGPQVITKNLPFPINQPDARARTVTNNNTMGDPNAPVKMIEYGDFQCPYCLRFWTETEPQIIETYVNTGKVFFEYRSVGAFIGPESAAAAEAAYCAGDQNKFWEYHDALFTNWTGENVGDFTEEKLIKYAAAIQLDADTFKKCVSDGMHKATVEQDAALAEADGVHATPTFFINGVRVEGAQPFHVLQQMIEEALHGNLNPQSG